MAKNSNDKCYPPPPEKCELCDSFEDLKTCSGCRLVFYCCREHQIQDWKKHKLNCKKNASRKNHNKSLSHSHSQENESLKSSQKSEGDLEKVTHDNTTFSNVKTTGKPGPKKSEHPVKSSEHREKSNKKKTSPGFDTRSFIHTDFPKPKGTDVDSISRHAALQLKHNGYCVMDSFLPQDVGLNILKEVKVIQDSGVLVDGPLSGGRTSSEKTRKFTEKEIRGDKITWMQGNEEGYPNIRSLIRQMDGLMQRLNYYLEGLYTISGRTKAMVACYPGNGTGYACHVDNPNRDGRCVTCLYYLNENWDSRSQGGLLRLLPVSGGYVDVQPVLNRLLLFWSDRRNPHEVQPAYDMRYAITVWYFDKSEREEAKMAQLNEDMNRLRGEVSLDSVKAQKEEKDRVKQELQKKSTNAVAALSEEELKAFSALLKGQPNPRAVLTNLQVAPSIQEALLSQLTEMESS